MEDAVGVDRALVGAELLQRLRAADRERGERQTREEGRRGRRQRDDGRVLVRGLAALVEALLRSAALRVVGRKAAEDRLPVIRRARVLEGALEVVPTVEVEADGVRVEVGSVLEFDALAQMERPRRAVVARLPALGQARLDLRRPRLEHHQGLEDLLDDPRRLAVRDENSVESDRVCRGAEDERTASTAAGGLARRCAAGGFVVPSAAPRRDEGEKRDQREGKLE